MASTELTKTYTSNGNRRTMTFSFWFKRSSGLGANQYLHSIYDASSGYQSDIRLRTTDFLRMYSTDTAGSTALDIQTNRKFRDTNAWYHVVFAVDTTQATDTDRLKLWVNGVQETSFSYVSYPAQNTDLRWNGNNNADTGGVNYIGSINSGQYFDGLMTHFHFIDGTAYDASYFGETDATTGIWKPKTAPSVTYGTNGFFLKFENSAAMGTDSSGNSNTFTVNGSMTKLIDTPSNVFATLNSLYNVTTFNGDKLSNGNTTATCSTNYKGVILSTLGASTGKYYFEAKITNTDSFAVGITNDAISLNTWSPSSGNYVFYKEDGNIVRPSGSTASGTTYGTNDIIGVAWNATDSEVTFYKNGSAIASAYGVEGTQGTMMFAIADSGTGSANTVNCNFGNGYFGTTAVSSAQNPDDGIGIFEYDVPAGYRALCTKSINAQEYS